MTWLADLGNIAAISTAGVAAGGYGLYRRDQWRKRRKLEDYLKAEEAKKIDRGQRTILHLMAELGLTESEILRASFASNHIARRIAPDPKTNRAKELLFEYRKHKIPD